MSIQGDCKKITHFSMFSNKYNSNHHVRIKRSKDKSTGQTVSLVPKSEGQTFPLKTKFVCRSGLNFDRNSTKIIPDCGVDNTDAQLLKYIGRIKNNSDQCRPFHILCSEENYVCFEIKDVCIYKINRYSQLVPWQNGAHLANCEHFTCNMMFKCPSSYCIP